MDWYCQWCRPLTCAVSRSLQLIFLTFCSSWYTSPPNVCINQTVNGVVISATAVSAVNRSAVAKLNTSILLEPVRITFQHQSVMGANPTCAFLNEQRVQLEGETWLTERCMVIERESSPQHTVCECYHLTSFALLLSPTGTVVSITSTSTIQHVHAMPCKVHLLWL